jgi:hypothetical protein
MTDLRGSKKLYRTPFVSRHNWRLILRAALPEGYRSCQNSVAGNGQKVACNSRTLSATAPGPSAMTAFERR